MPATENIKFEVELKMSGSADFVKHLKVQLENVNTAVKAVENSLNKGLGVSLDELINKAKQLSNTLGSIDSSKSGSGSGASIGVKIDFTPLLTVLNHIETQFNSSIQSVSSSLQQSAQSSVSVLEQVKLIRTKLYEIGSKFGVSAVSAGTISSSAIPVSQDGKGVKESINVTCKCNCGNGGNQPPQNPPQPNSPQPSELEEISNYLTSFSAAVSVVGVYSAYAYDKTVDLKESLYAVTLSASQTQAALETVSQQQIVSGYTTDQLKDATILLERMGASAKRYLPIAVNVAQKTGNKLAVVAEDLAGALDSLEALEAFQNKYKISDSDLKRNGAKFNNGKLEYTTSSDREAAGEALSKTLEQTFSSYNNVNTYGEAVNNLQNSIESLAAKVGEQLLPAFISVVSFGEHIVATIGEVDSSIIGLLSSMTVYGGVISGIIPVATRLISLSKTLPAALGPASGIIAIASTLLGLGLYAANSQIHEEQEKQKQLKEEADGYYNLKNAAAEYLAILKEINEENKGQDPHQIYGDRIANNPRKIEELEKKISDAEEQKKLILEKAKELALQDFKGEVLKDEDIISVLESSLEDVNNRIIEKQYSIDSFQDYNEGGRLYSTPPKAMPKSYDKKSDNEEELIIKRNQLRSLLQTYKNANTVISNASKAIEVAKKDRDDYAIFKGKIGDYKEQLSVIKTHGGEDSNLQVRETVIEAIKFARSQIAETYGHYFGGKDAEANLQDREFVYSKLLEFAKGGRKDSYEYQMLSALNELYKEKAATYPKPKEKDLETVLRELKESKGWQSSEETKQKRSGFKAEERINPEEWKDLGRQLEQASRDNRAYLQTHKEDLEKFGQAMDAWADKQMDIWEAWASAQLKGHDAAWAKTPEQRLNVSKRILDIFNVLQSSHKELLDQNEKLNDRLTNAIKEQAEAYSQALQERFEKESAGKTEDEILKAARRNLQSARSAKDLPEEMRVQEISKWKEHIQEALDSIQEKREEQQEKLRSMEAEKQNKQLEELEKRREKGEDVWPQMLILMRQMAAAEIEQVKLAEQKEIDALPEDLRDTQRELAEWHIAQTREKWQQQILEAYKRGNTKDTKELDKRKKEIDQTTAAKNAKEDEAVKRERERLSRPTTFRSYDEIKQYKDNQRLEALQKKADERKAKNTEQANAEKQRLEEEARQKELESEKALTDSLGNLDVSIKALTEAMISQSSMSGNKEGSSSSFLKDGKKETAGADAGGGSSAAEGTGTEAVSDKFRMALPYATAALSHAGQIYLSTGQEPIINPRMLEPLNQARELQERMARQVSSTVNNSTTSSTLQNFYIDGSKRAGDPDLRSLADSVSKILERRERRQRAYSGMW